MEGECVEKYVWRYLSFILRGDAVALELAGAVAETAAI